MDGLRGVLALSVLVHHFYITYNWKITGEWVRPESNFLNNLGAIPVSLFFLITGYLFLNKIRKYDLDWKKIYISRIKRIFPLYYFATTIVIIITLFTINIKNYELDIIIKWILGWLLFKGGNLGDFQSSLIIAGVNWTLLYEWGFYFSLPLIHALIHKKISNKTIFCITLLIFLLIFIETKRSLYLLFVLSFLSVYSNNINQFIRKYFILSNILITTLLIYCFFFTNAYSTLQKIILAIIFCCISHGYSFFGLLTQKGMKILGDISYSTYLLHGLILYISFTLLNIYNFNNGLIHYYFYFPAIFLLVVLVSFMSFKFIEKPFLK